RADRRRVGAGPRGPCPAASEHRLKGGRETGQTPERGPMHVGVAMGPFKIDGSAVFFARDNPLFFSSALSAVIPTAAPEESDSQTGIYSAEWRDPERPSLTMLPQGVLPLTCPPYHWSSRLQ